MTNLKHGLRNHRLYYVWNAMMKRCNNKNYPAYKRYGGRGITVCKRWHDVSNFIDDMNDSYSEGLTIDRIDNNKGYSPDNCRWVSLKKQARNRSNNVLYTYKGETMCISQWAERYGFKPSTMRKRLSKGWGIEKAVTTPLMR